MERLLRIESFVAYLIRWNNRTPTNGESSEWRDYSELNHSVLILFGGIIELQRMGKAANGETRNYSLLIVFAGNRNQSNEWGGIIGLQRKDWKNDRGLH